MKTNDLIDLLARGAGPAPRALAGRRLCAASAAGLLASCALALALAGPIPLAMYATAAPWIKLAYAGAMALATGWLAARLARPVARLAGPRRALLAVLLAMAALAAAAVAAALPADPMPALMGRSWRQCPWNVLALSLPALAAVLWALRGLAPTRLRLAGLAGGLTAGAIGALGYALACTELSPAFVAVWYSAGIGLAGLLGALLGPLVLRW